MKNKNEPNARKGEAENEEIKPRALTEDELAKVTGGSAKLPEPEEGEEDIGGDLPLKSVNITPR